MPSPSSDPLLAVEGIRKRFPGVVAVRDATLEVAPGEVHALVGENGAGKSTLVKVVAGALPADGGRLLFAGKPVRFPSPAAALAAGVAVIPQELDLVPQLSVRANLFLGREPSRLGFVDAREERRRARQVLARLGAGLDPDTRVADLDVARQQLVAIARALLADARVLVMDEPTSALSEVEVGPLLELVSDLRKHNLAILLVSHRLDEVLAVADRVTVMRDGVTLGPSPAAGLTREQLVERMVGRPLDQEFPKVKAVLGPEVLVVRDLAGARVRGVSFAVRAGEVLGLAGLVGAGRTDLLRLLFGAARVERGAVVVDGEPVVCRTPRDAIRAGICLLTEDRKAEGLILGLSACSNFALPNLDRWSARGFVRRRAERAAFARFVDALSIRLKGPDQPARELSGGNQQKLLLARWLERDPRVLLLDEPTRGVDVGARHELYLLVNRLAAQGRAVVMASSDLPEVLGMSDRVLVMRNGRIAGEIADPRAATQEQVMRLAVG